MKTIILLFLSVLIFPAFGQTPPKTVLESFNKTFATAEDVAWEKEDNEWEAEFKLNGMEMSVSFDNSGNWLETETEVEMKDVPADILKSVNLKFNGWEIEEIERIEKPDFKGYEMELENEETESEILVSDAGVITIKEVNVNDEEDEQKDDD